MEPLLLQAKQACFGELPTGVLDSLTLEQVMHCNTEDGCTQVAKSLPAPEAALLDWAINLMADFVKYDRINKMNARNIAMVFAPNMTQFTVLTFKIYNEEQLAIEIHETTHKISSDSWFQAGFVLTINHQTTQYKSYIL